MSKRRIMKHVRALRKDMLTFTKDLIRVQTENPPGSAYKDCVDLIAAKLVQFGVKPRIIRVRSDTALHPRYCLLASHGSGSKVLYFHGHYDVVPAADKHQFDPVARNSRLYGRGASDMKSGLASMIYAVRIMQLMEMEITGKVCLVIVPDEETGGKSGTHYLFEKGHLKKRNSIGMLMPEPTSGAIWHACRGAYSLMIMIKGKPVHVVLQQKGTNAFEQMSELVNALLKIKHSVEKRKTAYAVAAGESRHSILMLGGVCRCGTNFNVVPGECSFSVERRINPEENFDQEKNRLLNLLDDFRKKGIDIAITVLQEGEAVGGSKESYLARNLAGSIRAVTGKRPQFSMCPGLLEIRYYIRNGIPAYAYGPGLLEQSHHPGEFVPVERIYDCAAVYAMTAVKVLAQGGIR